MDILTYINKMNRLYGSESQVAGIGTGAVIPEELMNSPPENNNIINKVLLVLIQIFLPLRVAELVLNTVARGQTGCLIIQSK